MLVKLGKNKFNLVMTGLNMPSMNGAEALKCMNFFTRMTAQHDLLFTTDATLSSRKMANEAVFDAYLT